MLVYIGKTLGMEGAELKGVETQTPPPVPDPGTHSLQSFALGLVTRLRGAKCFLCKPDDLRLIQEPI